jgi:hypothetical protein
VADPLDLFVFRPKAESEGSGESSSRSAPLTNLDFLAGRERISVPPEYFWSWQVRNFTVSPLFSTCIFGAAIAQ